MTCEDDTKGERDTEIFGKNGQSLGKFRADFVKNLKLKNTGQTVEGKTLKKLKLKLKYQGRKGVIVGLKRVSKPGLRRYVRATEIPRVLGGMGTAIVSTPRGVMTGVDARKQNLGGELICYVW